MFEEELALLRLELESERNTHGARPGALEALERIEQALRQYELMSSAGEDRRWND